MFSRGIESPPFWRRTKNVRGVEGNETVPPVLETVQAYAGGVLEDVQAYAGGVLEDLQAYRPGP